VAGTPGGGARAQEAHVAVLLELRRAVGERDEV